MFWKKKDVKINTQEAVVDEKQLETQPIIPKMTEVEKLASDQYNIDCFDKRHRIIGDTIVNKTINFTATCKILDIGQVEVNTHFDDFDLVEVNNREYKYCFRVENLYSTAFYTKEKADEYLVKFLKFISKKNI
jgi:hypothetical protein